MRLIILIGLAGLLWSSCSKDKYTSSPQIKYKSLSPNFIDLVNPFGQTPVITLSVTDAEGDLGITDKDTAFIYLKNLLTGRSDSLPFPDLKDVTKDNFKADILVTVDRVLECNTTGSVHYDTLYIEIYVKDFGKNVSNTIVTGDPIFFQCD